MDLDRYLKNRKRIRRLRLWWAGVNDDAEAFAKRALGTLVLFGVVRIALYWKTGTIMQDGVTLSLSEWLWIIAFIILGWLVVSAIASAIRTTREEKKSGYWEGSKRIYNEPVTVLTREVKEEASITPITFRVDDAEPNAFVRFLIEHHVGQANGYILSPWQREILTWGRVNQALRPGKFLNDAQEAVLVADVPEYSMPTLIVVKMLWWECSYGMRPLPQASEHGDYRFINEPPQSLVDSLVAVRTQINTQHCFVTITRHDKRSFAIAEGIDRAFIEAGWITDFHKEIGHGDSPYAKFGIEVIGLNQAMVRPVVNALNQNGLEGVRPNQSMSGPVNKITIRVGVGD